MKSNSHIPQDELNLRIAKIQALLDAQDIDVALICSNANLYYTFGRVINGFAYIPRTGNAIFFCRRPVGMSGQNIIYIHKPEQIAEHITTAATVALELDTIPFSTINRLSKIFPNASVANASAILRDARAVKTDFELQCMRESGLKHAMVYSHIPALYQNGMTDLELQVEIERRSRLEGCIGQFRISGESMELFMGNLLCGDNADNPTPYDFAMGGAGLDPSLPVGCNGSTIKRGMSVMVDMNGNFTGYMTDMTRVFSCGDLSDLAIKAHNCSRRIVAQLASMGKPGTEAKLLYDKAFEIAQEEGLEDYFMGHRQKAGFVGHGVGIEVNEAPVLAPRSRDILKKGNTIALEPKFVIPQVGAVGVENTYIVTDNGMESITNAPEEIISLT